MLANGEQPARVADGGNPDADLIAMRQKVDLISVWLFRRIPLGVLAILVVYVGLRLADSSGREQWRVEAPKDKHFRTITVSPAGIHALRTDGVCQTFETQTGKQLWEIRLCEVLDYDVHMRASNDLLFVTSMEGLWVLEPTKGTVLFKQEDGPVRNEQVAIAGRCLLLGSEAGNRSLWRRWRTKDATNEQVKATGDGDPALTCVDFASGKVTWKRSFKNRNITHLAGDGDFCVCVSEIPSSWEWKPCAKHQKIRMLHGQQCPDCVSRWIPALDNKIEVIDTATSLTRWHCKLRNGEVRRIEMRGGRLVILTDQRLYTIGADGREIGRIPWISSNLTETVLISDQLLGIDMQGGIHAANTSSPAPTWNCSPRRYMSDLIADGDTIYVSTVEKGDLSEPEAANAAPAAHAQLIRELWGDGEQESPGGGPTRRILSALDPADGSTRWRREDMLGRIVPYGDMFLRITEGYETALIFPDGGTVLYAHLARNGRQVWYSKIPFAMHDLTLLPDRIVAIVTKGGSGLFDSGSTASSAIASFNRRSLLNRLMRP